MSKKEFNKLLCIRKKSFRGHKFNLKELQKGIKVELEHTKNRKVAEQIAKDHLVEDPKYYSKLKTLKL